MEFPLEETGPTHSSGLGAPILIVEANFSSQSAIKNLIDRIGLRNVTVTGRGYRAIEVCERQKFEVILISNGLVQLEGTDVIQVIREKGLNRRTPIIFIGESENDRHIRKALQYGASLAVAKPLYLETFRATLENFLKIRLTTPEEERIRVQASMAPMRRAVEFAKKLRSEGECEIAEEEFKKGLVEIFCGLAEVYLSKGDREAEQLDPQARENFEIREENFIEHGQSCLRKKAYIGAKAEFNAALSLNQESVPALVGMGEAHYGLEEEEEAKATFDQLMEVHARKAPEDPAVFRKMALIACRNRQFDLACRALDRALALYPSDAKLHYLKAVAYLAEGRIEQTLPLIEKALFLDPELTEARTLENKVRRLVRARKTTIKARKANALEDFLIH